MEHLPVGAVCRGGAVGVQDEPPALPVDADVVVELAQQDAVAGAGLAAVFLVPQMVPAVYCDVHHLRHKKDGGETSVQDCVLLCQFHHDVCIHRRGWQLILHPDGTTEARSPDGKQILYSHAPPTEHAA